METKCQEPAVFRYTWPGKDEACICLVHAQGLKQIASAMGFYIQLIPLSDKEQETAHCSQIVK